MKVWLAALLLFNVMVHPAEHALMAAPSALPQCVPASSKTDGPGRLQSSDVCLTCRNASSLIATPLPATPLGSSPPWEKVLVPTDFLPFQGFLSSSPVRAPPLA